MDNNNGHRRLNLLSHLAILCVCLFQILQYDNIQQFPRWRIYHNCIFLFLLSWLYNTTTYFIVKPLSLSGTEFTGPCAGSNQVTPGWSLGFGMVVFGEDDVLLAKISLTGPPIGLFRCGEVFFIHIVFCLLF